MIKNDKQYQVTKSRLKEFKDMLYDVLSNNEINVDPIYRKIEEDAVKSQITQFEKEIEEYEFLKNGEVNYIYVDSLPNFYEALIKARIVKGWTQAELAKHLELKEQQIQRYELCNYSTASIARINEVASALNIDISPLKIKIAQPEFNISPELNAEIINGYNKMKETKSVLQF